MAPFAALMQVQTPVHAAAMSVKKRAANQKNMSTIRVAPGMLARVVTKVSTQRCQSSSVLN